MDSRVLKQFAKTLDGDLFFDSMMRRIYATDASLYRALPLAVCYPKGKEDIKKLERRVKSTDKEIAKKKLKGK